MAYNVSNYQRIWVRGRFVDMVKAAREDTTIGLSGPVQFIPQIPVALDADTKQILGLGSFSASPAPTDGYFAINLPSTNDPDINPVDFKYKVVEPTGRSYLIVVPYDTPVLVSPGDPLDGERVLELVNVVPDPDDPTGTVQLLVGQTGRGIANGVIDGTGHLILTYDDEFATTVDAGLVTGVTSVNGETGTVDLSDTYQALDSDLTAVAGIAASNDDFIQRKAGAWTNRTVAQVRTDLNQVKPFPPVNLTPGATPALNAALGTHFRVTMAIATTTIGIPTNPTDGQVIVIEATSDGSARTLALNTGVGGFDLRGKSLTATAANKTDYVQACYNLSRNKWEIIGVDKGA